MKCSSCRNIKPATIKCQSFQETVNIYQFELTEIPYKKIYESGNTIEKVSKKNRQGWAWIDLQGTLWKTPKAEKRINLPQISSI